MAKALASAMLPILLAACDGRGHGDGKAGGAVAGAYPILRTPLTSGRDAIYSLSVENRDQGDYVLEILWRDGSGKLCQDVVLSLTAGSPESPSRFSQDVPATSGRPYALVLKDPWDGFMDVQSLPVVVPGDLVPISFAVDRGALLSR